MKAQFYFTTLITALLYTAISSQNLVQDGGFETSLDNCSITFSEPTSAFNNYWESVQNNSPDPYYCTDPFYAGFAHTGDGALGLITYALSNTNIYTFSPCALTSGRPFSYREYVETALTASMQPCKKYKVELWVRMDTTNGTKGSNFGLYFSTNPINYRIPFDGLSGVWTANNVFNEMHQQVCDSLTFGLLSNADAIARSEYIDYIAATHIGSLDQIGITPQLQHPTAVTARWDWEHIVFEYTPDQSYNYLTIGNFNNAAATVITPISPNDNPSGYAYMFFDDISITEMNSPNIDSNIVTLCQGDNYVVGTNSYTTNGIYRDTFVRTGSTCGDSIVVSNLTFNACTLDTTYIIYDTIYGGQIVIECTPISPLLNENTLTSNVTSNITTTWGNWRFISDSCVKYNCSPHAVGEDSITFTTCDNNSLCQNTIIRLHIIPAPEIVTCTSNTTNGGSTGWVEVLEGLPGHIGDNQLPCGNVVNVIHPSRDTNLFLNNCDTGSYNGQYYRAIGYTPTIIDDSLKMTFTIPIRRVKIGLNMYFQPDENLQIGFNGTQYALQPTNITTGIQEIFTCIPYNFGTEYTLNSGNIQSFNNNSPLGILGSVGEIEITCPIGTTSLYIRDFVPDDTNYPYGGTVLRVWVEYDCDTTSSITTVVEAPDTLYCNQRDTIHTCYNGNPPRWALASNPNTIIYTGTALEVYPTTTTDYLVYFDADTFLTRVYVVNASATQSKDTVYTCNGDSIRIFGKYENIPGIYIDTLVNSSGCDSIISIQLIVYVPTQSSRFIDRCEGQSYFVAGQNQTITGIYYDTLTNSIGCDSVLITNLTFNAYPIINLGNDTLLCEGNTITLFANATQGSIQWQDGSTNSIFQVNNSGTYWAILNNSGCLRADTIQISIAPNPANFLADSLFWCWDNPSAVVQVRNYTSYNWSDGSTNNVLIPTMEASYWLQVTDSNNCTGTDSIRIVEYCAPNLYVPNVFTPNIDGKNEVFMPVSYLTGFEKYQLEIYNRWGQKVWDSNNYPTGWNGLLDGKMAEDGVYNWKVEYVYRKYNKRYTGSKAGKIMLLR